VVVLSIMGLAAALAAPSVIRSVDSWQARAQVDALAEQMRGLPARARGLGRAVVVDDEALAGSAPPLRVPEGWTLSSDAAWTVRANGYCEGGTVDLEREGRRWRLRASAPFCDVAEDDA
jgi:type II secretory pathway pseudopilin PulG